MNKILYQTYTKVILGLLIIIVSLFAIFNTGIFALGQLSDYPSQSQSEYQNQVLRNAIYHLIISSEENDNFATLSDQGLNYAISNFTLTTTDSSLHSSENSLNQVTNTSATISDDNNNISTYYADEHPEYTYQSKNFNGKYQYAFLVFKDSEHVYDSRDLPMTYLFHCNAQLWNCNLTEGSWIYVSVPESLSTIALSNSTSLIAQINNWIYLVCTFYQASLLLFILSYAVAIILLIFLMHLAGHRPNSTEITLRFVDRIPFLIYTVIITIADVVLGVSTFGVLITFSRSISTENLILFCFSLMAIMIGLTTCYLTSIATRIAAKSFWKNTLLHYICIPFKKVHLYCQENTTLYKKSILYMIIISLIELCFIFLFCIYMRSGALFGLFFLYKLITIPLFLCIIMQANRLYEGGKRLAAGDLSSPIDTNHLYYDFKKHAQNLNAAQGGINHAVEEKIKSERMKTELITNVSHDIKTPLTSIINYVDLLQKEDLNNPKAKEYLDVLNRQSARLKKLIEDLIEASKASTGNLDIHPQNCDTNVMLAQAVGEFEEKAKEKELDIVINKPDYPVNIYADGRYLWRIFDNLLTNICKYAMNQSRVYIDIEPGQNETSIIFKNISNTMLNISSDELMERFVRGDSSRNDGGNGLGLSIAKSLAELMNGHMDVNIDGDLFKVTLEFPNK